jgi:dolichyl-phosphate beta-glucosyltransferase
MSSRTKEAKSHHRIFDVPHPAHERCSASIRPETTLKLNSLSVVVPAYNEGARIELTLAKLAAHLERNFPQYEVIVIDDGSMDSTAEKVRKFAAANSRIVLHSLPINRGKGFAVREGVTRAKGDAILFTDADLSTPVEEIDLALAELTRGFAVVIASRRHPNSIIARRQSWTREAIGRGFNRLIRALFSLPFKDTQCGFKCFTQEAAKAIFARATIDTFSFDVEILIIAMGLGYAIKEIPVHWTNAPGSKVRPLKDAATIALELLTLYRNSLIQAAMAKQKRANR